jgi:hypothetical protein
MQNGISRPHAHRARPKSWFRASCTKVVIPAAARWTHYELANWLWRL